MAILLCNVVYVFPNHVIFIPLFLNLTNVFPPMLLCLSMPFFLPFNF